MCISVCGGRRGGEGGEGGGCLLACLPAYLRICVRACLRACVPACVSACVRTRACAILRLLRACLQVAKFSESHKSLSGNFSDLVMRQSPADYTRTNIHSTSIIQCITQLNINRINLTYRFSRLLKFWKILFGISTSPFIDRSLVKK